MSAKPKIDLMFYMGDHIRSICSNKYHKNNDNHCAHFVSHVMGFNFGFLCRNMTGAGKGGATIRVQDIFTKCQKVGEWSNKPCELSQCIAFVTDSKNIDLKNAKMQNVPKKHVGIYKNGMIYHYSNGRNMVVSQTPAQFENHYRGKDVTVYYGTFPK